ncbi:TPA: aspartyl-tRNA amidotransferase [Candidatus Poribacteria bacterium]|nr:aspartyl-tRNA amidotransferase [Dehalococcoidia bacterium]HCK14684.1 aspartyl-tRNA amidotransferase [Candidatus Poribacteria bacterium]|tara:strand:+ start:698 stop:1144 length:447 start_codon:yes stop_codon:yes gene_type:complete
MLRETLDSDLKDAMRNKEALKRTVLRTMLSEIRNAEIDSRTTLDDEGIISVLTKQMQQRKDSVEAYLAANRQDLVDKETEEINIISVYLPEQLPSEEIEAIITAAILETGASSLSDMGKVMGFVMPQVKGRADGKIVNTIVTEKLRAL